METFPALRRTELRHTIREQLRWQTPGGNSRVQLALRLLAALEGLGIVQLPPLCEGPKRGNLPDYPQDAATIWRRWSPACSTPPCAPHPCLTAS